VVEDPVDARKRRSPIESSDRITAPDVWAIGFLGTEF
jgi:hypothetical protein